MRKTTRGLAIFGAALLVALGSTSRAGRAEMPALQKPQIVHFGPGAYNISDAIVLEGPHSVLEGAGRGVTILYAPNGVIAVGPDPIIRNLTIVGQGAGTGLSLRNTWSALVENVEIEDFQLGLGVELTADGRTQAGGATMKGWPGADSGGKSWGSRVTLTEIRNIEITGGGDGISLRNALKHSESGKYSAATDEQLPGEFFTATTIWGGHIFVKGTALKIGDGVWNTKVIGSYIDVGPGGGIDIEYGAQFVDLIGVNLDLSSGARNAGTPKLTCSRRAMKTLQIVGSDELSTDSVAITEP